MYVYKFLLVYLCVGIKSLCEKSSGDSFYMNAGVESKDDEAHIVGENSRTSRRVESAKCVPLGFAHSEHGISSYAGNGIHELS